MSNPNLLDGQFDGGQISVTSSGWTRLLTLATNNSDRIVGIDVAVATAAVNLRITRTARPGEVHGAVVTDLTQNSRRLLGTAVSGSGTQTQPGAGAIVLLDINTEGCAEIGIEAQAVSTTTNVRAYGSANTSRKLS